MSWGETLTPSPSPWGETLTPSPSPWGEGSRNVGRWRRISEEMLRRARELRGRQTTAEEILWECLRGRRLAGIKFRRQHQVGRYILDFFSMEGRLGVELDGSIHVGREDIDAARSRELTSMGVRVIRFSNEQVYEDLVGVLTGIVEAVERPSPPTPLPGERGALVASASLPDERGTRAASALTSSSPSPLGEGPSSLRAAPLGGEGQQSREAESAKDLDEPEAML